MIKTFWNDLIRNRINSFMMMIAYIIVDLWFFLFLISEMDCLWIEWRLCSVTSSPANQDTF